MTVCIRISLKMVENGGMGLPTERGLKKWKHIMWNSSYFKSFTLHCNKTDFLIIPAMPTTSHSRGGDIFPNQ